MENFYRQIQVSKRQAKNCKRPTRHNNNLPRRGLIPARGRWLCSYPKGREHLRVSRFNLNISSLRRHAKYISKLLNYSFANTYFIIAKLYRPKRSCPMQAGKSCLWWVIGNIYRLLIKCGLFLEVFVFKNSLDSKFSSPHTKMAMMADRR